MEFRHEWKHELSPGDLPALRSRLRAVAAPDEHGENGAYRIRSLYFDTPTDRALREKIDGVTRREKFRLRRYGGGRPYTGRCREEGFCPTLRSGSWGTI